jgi:hypothetical protein
MSVPTEQEQTPAVTAEETAVVDTAQPEPLVAEAPAPEPVVIPVATPAPLATVEPEPAPAVQSTPAPQPAPEPQPTLAAAATPETETSRLLGLPLQLINQLLARLGAAPLHNLADLLPALRLVSLLVVAGITIKLTGATLGAINELPLIGRLLELVGLISALQFLAANALRSQKRAELLARIQKLKRDFLG